MKSVLFVIIFLFSCNVAASDNDDFRFGMSVILENASEVSTIGAAVITPFSFGMIVGNAGLSFSRIESDKNITEYDKVVHPVYVLINTKLNYRVSPLVEFGFHLGDSIIDEIFDNNDEYVDIYYMGGVAVNVAKDFSLSFYRKRYHIKYYDGILMQKAETGLSTYGVTATYLF